MVGDLQALSILDEHDHARSCGATARGGSHERVPHRASARIRLRDLVVAVGELSARCWSARRGRRPRWAGLAGRQPAVKPGSESVGEGSVVDEEQPHFDLNFTVVLTSCFGSCSFEKMSKTIVLYQPMLQGRTSDDLKNALLHLMIHAIIFVKHGMTCLRSDVYKLCGDLNSMQTF